MAGFHYPLFSFVSGEAAPGQQAYTTPGTYSFIVPTGVTTICAVLVGAGATGSSNFGGAGGSLRYINNLPVTPGETLTVFVGAGGGYGTTGPTTIKRGTDTLLLASSNNTGGYWANPEIINPSTPTGAGPYGGTVGGGNGGSGAGTGGYAASGGGGAGGYSGNGGNGSSSGTGSSGSGGAGGGGGGWSGQSNWFGGGGGGVGILGQGTNGGGGGTYAGGGGGSGGTDGDSYKLNQVARGGAYGGGGGGGGNLSMTAGYSPGGNGAARIIWGSGRSFPSTNTANV